MTFIAWKDNCWILDLKHYLYHADCEGFMQSCEGFKADLVFADPPFNIGETYDSHDDNMPSVEFYQFTNSWLSAAMKLVKSNGILAINVPDSMVCFILTLCNFQRIDWVIWHYRFGQCGKSKFISSHTHCLIFRNGYGPHTFNAEDIMVPSLRASKYNDIRTMHSETPGMRVPFDVWDDIPRVVGNSKERVAGHPNQLPLKYLERIVRAYTNKGEMVLDPFGGTGTTAAVCKMLSRRSCTIEKSAAYCADIRTRLEGIDGGNL